MGRSVSRMGNTNRIDDIAVNILTLLKSEERSIRWLATKTDIKYSTLYHQLTDRPKNLTHVNVLRIAGALGVDESAFLAEEVAA